MTDSIFRYRLELALIRDEGVRLHVYDDATGQPLRRGKVLVGYPTIGVGRNLFSRGLTLAEARMLLYNDIQQVTDEMHRAFPWAKDLSETRQEVLANMLFNMGLKRLNTFKRALTAMEDGRYADAADEMLDSKWATQVGQRAVRLATTMRTDEPTAP